MRASLDAGGIKALCARIQRDPAALPGTRKTDPLIGRRGADYQSARQRPTPPPLLLSSCLIGRDIRTLCKRGREQKKKNNNGGGETRAGLYKFPFRRETRAIAKSSSIEEPRGGVGRRGRLKRAKSRFPRGISHFLRGARSCLFSLSPSLAICLFGKLLGALELCMRSFLCAREHAAPRVVFSLSLYLCLSL